MSKIECPNCEEDVEIHHEDHYETDVLQDVECPHCQNIFGVETSYEPIYATKLVPCWNDQPCDFKDYLEKIPEAKDIYSVWRECRLCGKEERKPK